MGIKRRVKELIWNKEWTEEQVGKYVGFYEKCHFTYALDESLRAGAASGGSTSALLVYLLESGRIDGALVCRGVVKDGKARAVFFIATTREEIMAAQGSKYAAVYFTSDAFPLIKAYEGRLAVVALPCDAKLLRRYRDKHPDIDEKVKYVFTLFCGHNSEPELTDMVTQELGEGHGQLVDYTWRYGVWRGKLKATYEDGTEVEKPFEHFSDYRNLYLFAQQKCHHCFDHYGYFCDISAGDIWSPRMKEEPIKHTALITRSEAGEALVQQTIAEGVLHGTEEPLEEVLNGQARTMPFHYNISSRSKVGKWFGLNIKDHTREKVRPLDYLIAFIAVFNERFSRTPFGQAVIKRMPRPLIKFYVRVFKVLESF